MKRFAAFLLAAVMIFSLAVCASAADGRAEAAADELNALGLFKGTGTGADGKPTYELDRAPTRAEAVTMLVRLLGKESEARSGKWDTPFTDVADWAAPYVGYAYSKGLTKGVSDTEFGSTANVTASQYLTFVLRALGYDSSADFQWDAAWELSDRLGLTAGEYSAANNAGFLRGDAAIVSASALGIKLKSGDKTLKDSIFAVGEASDMTKEDYLARSLTDREIAALRGADADKLKEKLSTLGDVIAYIDSLNPLVYSALMNGYMKLGFSLKELYENGDFGTESFTVLAAYCLADDYPGMGCIAAEICDNSPWLLSALYLPVREGYWICTPAYYSGIKNNNNCYLAGIAEVTVSDLMGLEKSLEPLQVGMGLPLIEIWKVSDYDPELAFLLSDTGMELQTGRAERVYRMSSEELERAKERIREGAAAGAMDNARRNWSSYGMPASLDPTLTESEAGALFGRSLAEAADAIKTIGDCICYYAAAGYQASGGDLQTASYDEDFVWHYNYAPERVLAHNYGCCGSTSGLTAALLQGDYDEVGIIGITFPEGEGGGHVINYVRNGGEYYVFDMVNLVSSGFSQRGYLFSKADSLEAAAKKWSDASIWNEVLMYAYQSFDGDAPVGWGWSGDHTSYLSDEYADGAVILMETPARGYVYRWVSVSRTDRQRIDDMRYER